MFETIEDRLRRVGFGLTPAQEPEERALRAARAELQGSRLPAEPVGARRDLRPGRTLRPPRGLKAALLVATALSVVAAGLGVWALLATSTDSSSPEVLAVEGGSDRFPSESLTDWVSYADQVSIVSVTKEEALPAEFEPGDGFVLRVVTLRIEETIWRREGAPVAGENVRVITWGWDGRRPITAWGSSRLEVGSRYLIPLLRAPRDGVEWTPLSGGATLPLDGNVITTTGVVGQPSQIATDLRGKTPGALADALARTPPDPIAAKYFDLPPDERWEAVVRETGGSYN